MRHVTPIAVAVLLAVSPASASGWADDEAQAQTCDKTLDLLTTAKIDEAIDAILLEAQPWDARAAKTRAEYGTMADSLRGFLQAGLDSVHKQNESTIVRAHRIVSRPTFGERIIHLEQWEFDNGRKVYAGCVRWPNASPGRGWVTEMEFGPDEAEVIGKLGDKVKRAGEK